MALSPTMEARTNKLFKLGLKFDGQQFVFQDINFHWTDLLCMSDKEFDKALAGAEKRKKDILKETH